MNSYSQGYVEGVFYYFFNMQRQETIYNPDGTVWGTAAQGALVAARGSQGGQSHPDWLQIYAVQRMPDRSWVRINSGQSYDWGFIPVGLEDGSMPTTISLYGSW